MSMLRDVFSITAILGGRGIKLTKWDNIENTLIKSPSDSDKAFQHIRQNGTLNLLDDIESNAIFSSKGKNNEEAQKLRASTFEWFVSEILKREFYFHSAQFGVEIEDGWKPVGNCDEPMGDFDVVGISRNLEPTFLECKTGNPNNIDPNKFYNVVLRGLAVQSPYTVMILEQSISMESLCRKLNSKHWPRGMAAPSSRECEVDRISPIAENLSEYDVFMWGTLFIVNMYSELPERFVLPERLGNVFKIVGALKSGSFWSAVSCQAPCKDNLLIQAGFKVSNLT
jgi:hypothetical protein